MSNTETNNMSTIATLNADGQHIIQDTETGKFRFSLVEDSSFVSAIEGLSGFFYEMNPDIDMCYDYVCEVADCHSFVCDEKAWNMFYEEWEKVAEENGIDA